MKNSCQHPHPRRGPSSQHFLFGGWERSLSRPARLARSCLDGVSAVSPHSARLILGQLVVLDLKQ